MGPRESFASIALAIAVVLATVGVFILAGELIETYQQIVAGHASRHMEFNHEEKTCCRPGQAVPGNGE
ncbi:TPA_asm: hypothetical protein [ssRNA phage SRR7976357_4]|uniref:Uncharacterized protein n=1 Tax=ssRNA phage SRR7976357_4 TaxID=2786744 RepID=A0A8S5KZW7_9VIRU|nr:hypothetical protein QII75_gp4 [ssRNA phage SRR7976357_4]DAD51246.1 TPA_asm: hypothetical protein [ssRNA phage SRR7976357_4]